MNSPAAPARWRLVVGTLALTEIVSWGILYYAFGVLVEPMQAELGWSQGQLGAAFSLALFVSAFLAMPVARWLERHGPRAPMAAGSCAGALLLFAWSQVEHLGGLFVLFAALGFPLATVLYEPAFAAVIALLGAGRRTDLALLFLTIVAGLANTVFVPLTQWLVDEHGWRAALRILALVLGAITIPLHALVLRGVPGKHVLSARAEAGPPASAAVSRLVLGLCAVAFGLSQVAGTALGVYLLPILVEQGFDPSFAAAAVSLTGVAQVFGRPTFIWLLPRYSLGFWSAALFLPFGAGVAVLALQPSHAVVLASVFVMSMASGSLTLARTTWTLELFPVASFARVNGTLGRWSLIGRAGAPLAMGAAHDLSGSHRLGLVAVSCACIVGGASAWQAARLGRRTADPQLTRERTAP